MATAADPPLPSDHLTSNPASPIEEKTTVLEQPYIAPSSVLPVFEPPLDCFDNLVESEPFPIYAINAEQYNRLQDTYFTTPLPNDILFPWLHGVDGRSYQQCLFFGIRQCLVPVHRGLTLVHADEVFSNQNRLVGSVLPNEILSTGENPDFLDTTESELGINLRNFRIQVARYATISDIVVYGTGAIDVARKISAAQNKIKAQRQEQLKTAKQQNGNRPLPSVNDLDYRTFVIIDPFNTFEQTYPGLVCLDSQGNAINRINFWEQEREEMYVLTKASEITTGVWLGNTQDVPLSSEDEISNPHQISICIETHDLADMPLPSTLTLARVTLNDLPKDQLPDELIHLDCYSSGSSLTSVSAFDIFYSQLAHLLEFIDEQVMQGRRILIHCADGYTETSMLALSWIMYKERLRLPGAYLHLQELRSFFVYSSDVEILQRVEKKILEPSNTREHKRKREETTGQEEIEQLSIGGAAQTPGMCNRKPSIDDKNVDPVKKEPVMVDDDEDDETDLISSEDEPEDHATAVATDRRQLFDDTYMSQVPKHLASSTAMDTDHRNDVDEVIPILDTHRTAQGGGPSSLDCEPEEIKVQYPWFYSERFEGSFPSRILPFLYLGNLNHATNPKVLKALGITHVLSVGENANLGDDFKLLLLDNLYDDGIDSLWGHIDDCIKHIDEARLQGTKCLIHCRVGVSRSATITICYVMKHMRMSLVQAYLFVRARRLNVIIQPNLKFMYELLQYEQRLLGKVQIFWQILSKEIHSLNMCYRES